MVFDIKKLGNDVFDVSKEALKTGEQFIEDKTDTSIDFFTDPKTQEQRNEVSTETHEETEKIKTEVDFKESEILSNVKEGIKEGFNKLKTKIPDKTIEKGKDSGKTYLEVVEAKYNSIIKKLDSCKNDGELFSKYQEIRLEIVSWIEELSKKETGLMEGIFSFGTGLEALKKETVNGLDDLRIELTRFEGMDAVEKMKAEIKEKNNKETEGNEKIKSMLTEVGVPVGLAGLIAGFLGLFGIGKDSKIVGFFSSIMEAFKDPVNGFKNLFGFGGKKDEKGEEKAGEKEEDKQKDVIVKGQIKENLNFTTYTNNNIEIKTKDKKIEYVKLNGKDYKFNLDNIGEITFFQKNDIDYIKIGDKEIDLFTFIGQIREEKNSYLVSQYFVDGDDLKLEVVS